LDTESQGELADPGLCEDGRYNGVSSSSPTVWNNLP